MNDGRPNAMRDAVKGAVAQVPNCYLIGVCLTEAGDIDSYSQGSWALATCTPKERYLAVLALYEQFSAHVAQMAKVYRVTETEMWGLLERDKLDMYPEAAPARRGIAVFGKERA